MATHRPPSFQHVNYLWDEDKAQHLGTDEVALLLYRSNLLGADLRITNFGGGNTSCRTIERDPLSGEETEVLWIKGSGGDLGSLKRNGLAGLHLERLRALKGRYRGKEYEDEVVPLYYHCLFDLDSRAPSIDTALHAFLPFRHIDHLHPDAVIAIAAAKDGRQICETVYEGQLGWVPWQRPGFDLALQLRNCLDQNPGIRGIILEGHGLFTWGDSAHSCYQNSLEVIEKAGAFLAGKEGKKRPVFGGVKWEEIPREIRHRQAARLAPLLRGLCSNEGRMVGHFSDDERVLQFVNSQDLEQLAPMGTSCPDHFLRTKIRPLLLDLPPLAALEDLQEVKTRLSAAFEAYRQDYHNYYQRCKQPDSPPLRDPNPVVLLWPGIGMFTFAKNKQTARVAAEFYTNAINVMRGAEAVSSYVALSEQEAFNIEYWQLEEDKLRRQPAEKPLARKVALITGGGGGIGRAIAEKLAAEGACVVLTDNSGERLMQAQEALESRFGRDAVAAVLMDVTDGTDIGKAFEAAALAFGGLDILVHSAGLSISRPMEQYTEAEWDLLQSVMPRGQFLASQTAVGIMRTQGLGGDIVNIVSKNALVAGPSNLAYGAAKAAQLHMGRLLAAELGPDRIRVNTVNPDAVIEGSHIWQGGWARERAQAYGIPVEELPAFYAKRTLLHETILPEDIAQAVFAFVGGLLNKSTGNVLNVDGGLPGAFVR